MSFEPGDRVFLTVSSRGCHPPVGTNGTVREVTIEMTANGPVAGVVVDWDTDDRARTTVTRWNGRLAPAGS